MSAAPAVSNMPFWIFIGAVEYNHKAAIVTLGYQNLQTLPKIAVVLLGKWS